MNNMKTLAVIGASYLQRPLVEKAKEMGLRVICFAWAEGAVCKDICDAFYPISTMDVEGIKQLAIKERVDMVLGTLDILTVKSPSRIDFIKSGFCIIECLFLLFLFAVFILIGISRYRITHHRTKK